MPACPHRSTNSPASNRRPDRSEDPEREQPKEAFKASLSGAIWPQRAGSSWTPCAFYSRWLASTGTHVRHPKSQDNADVRTALLLDAKPEGHHAQIVRPVRFVADHIRHRLLCILEREERGQRSVLTVGEAPKANVGRMRHTDIAFQASIRFADFYFVKPSRAALASGAASVGPTVSRSYRV